MTFTIMGYCRRTAQIGVTSATFSVNASHFNMPYSQGVLPRFRENGAIVMAQAFSSFPLPFIICDLLEKGASFYELHEAMKKRFPVQGLSGRHRQSGRQDVGLYRRGLRRDEDAHPGRRLPGLGECPGERKAL